MIQIKKTKSIVMIGDENGVILSINTYGSFNNTGEPLKVLIPMKSVFQVRRGLESYVQKFYRKAVKK